MASSANLGDNAQRDLGGRSSREARDHITRDRPRDFIWRGFLDDLDVALQECVGDAIESGAHAAVAALRESTPPPMLWISTICFGYFGAHYNAL